MKQILVKPYTQDKATEWDVFCKNAHNTTFITQRNFMDYHKDRFKDNSLMVYQDTTLVAVLPAHLSEKICYSHNGLTYGGFIFKPQLKLKKILDIVAKTLLYLNENGIETLVLKQIPDFYKSSHSQELEYAFFLVEATLDACEAASVINLNFNFQIQSNRLEGLKKAKNQNLILKEEADFSSFWQQLLEPMLKRQFNKEPTHSLEEIKRLKTNFPERIKQYNVYQNKKIVAGTTIFETSNAVHTQYIASDTNRQLLGSLDYLFHWLITQHYKDKNYFSFGTSNFKKGSVLNSGLNYWKETFGARTQVHKTYILKTANYNYITSALK